MVCPGSFSRRGREAVPRDNEILVKIDATSTIFTIKNLTFQVKENSLCARIAAWKLRCDKVAIVFGSTIHLHNTTKEEFLSNKKWVCHELKHIEQYKRYGFFTFIYLYLVESAKNGYIKNKFEVEASEAEKEDSTNYLKYTL